MGIVYRCVDFGKARRITEHIKRWVSQSSYEANQAIDHRIGARRELDTPPVCGHSKVKQNCLSISDMETVRTKQNSAELVEARSHKLFGGANSRMEMSSAPAQDVYEIRLRKDRNGFDLISDRLRRGLIWYAGPDAVRNAVAFAKYRSLSRSGWAIIRVFNEAGNVIETHEHKGEFTRITISSQESRRGGIRRTDEICSHLGQDPPGSSTAYSSS
jgi:hypothetical protein